MKKFILSFLLFIGALFSVKAQIGYQVSLLNTATGEPRANVTVNATVTITNSKGESIYTGTQSATSNDFGVLSLTVGNANTFKDVDFGELPFFIEVSVDGQMIGKSQILNVPVAEAAKKIVPAITEISGTYVIYVLPSRPSYTNRYVVNINIKEGKGTCVLQEAKRDIIEEVSGVCEIEGNTIYAFLDNGSLLVLRYFNGKLYATVPMGVDLWS